MTPPDHILELPPDPHEDWYFELLPPDWKRLPAAVRQEYIRSMDPVQRAECRRRMRMRAAVSAGKELAKREVEAEAAMWLGAALDDAMEAIANRVHPWHLLTGDDDDATKLHGGDERGRPDDPD